MPRPRLTVDPAKLLAPKARPSYRKAPRERREGEREKMSIKRAASMIDTTNGPAKVERNRLLLTIYQDAKDGKPQVYTGEPHDELVIAMRLTGCSRDQVAAVLHLKVDELDKWLQSYPSFKAAWTEGGDFADGQVAARLFQRAIGFYADEDKIFCNKDGEVTVVKTREYFPPDVAAQKLWLINRQQRHWKDRQSNEFTGPDGSALPLPVINVLPVRAIAPSEPSDES